jgi:hypothetical protein
MNKYYYFIIRIVLSVIISFCIISGIVAVISYADPTFTIGFLDLLRQYSITAWLLLILSSGILFGILTKIPDLGIRGKTREGADRASD